ncbi:MAG: hypothetical protein WDO18_15860 [Acidobacteriota bacterium]
MPWPSVWGGDADVAVIGVDEPEFPRTAGEAEGLFLFSFISVAVLEGERISMTSSGARVL